MAAEQVTCALDTDCEDYLVCYFSSTPESRCGCHVWYGKGGPACRDWGPSTYVLVLTALWTASVVVVSLVPAALAVGRAVRRFGLGALKSKAPLSTLTLAFIALAALGVHQTMYALEAILPLSEAKGTIWLEPKTQQKQFWLRPYMSVAGTVMATAAGLAGLNVTVLWLEVSQRLKGMQVATSENVQRYRRACLATGVFVTLAAATLALLDLRGIIPIMMQPVTLTIAVLSRIGRRRLCVALENACEMEAKNPAMQASLRKAIRDISKCSWRVSTGYFAMLGGALVLLAIAQPIGPDPRGWCSTDRVCPPLLVGQLVYQIALGIIVSVLRYALLKTNALLAPSSPTVSSRAVGTSPVSSKSTSNAIQQQGARQ